VTGARESTRVRFLLKQLDQPLFLCHQRIDPRRFPVEEAAMRVALPAVRTRSDSASAALLEMIDRVLIATSREDALLRQRVHEVVRRNACLSLVRGRTR